MRVPRPAASTMARRGVDLVGDALMRSCLQWRHVCPIPGRERLERRMGERPLQIAPYPRQMTQILRLPVAPLQASEDAEDFGCPLRSERCVSTCEVRRVECRIGGTPRARVARE